MGEASMRKWMRRARRRFDPGAIQSDALRAEAHHQRLRARRLRRFWRMFDAVPEWDGATGLLYVDDCLEIALRG